jgi:hypothetical protein
MLDGIAKKGGPVMVDRTLAYLRSGLNWYAARTDDWVSPIVRGMARTKPKERTGTRVLIMKPSGPLSTKPAMAPGLLCALCADAFPHRSAPRRGLRGIMARS